MTTWQHSTPSNQTTPIHQHNSRVEGSPSDPPGLPVEETLEYQEEYPRGVAEEVEEEVSLPQYQRNQRIPMGGINSLAIRHSSLQEIAQNLKCS